MIEFEFYTERATRIGMVSFVWRWRQRGTLGAAVESAGRFSAFRDCVADARQHGFREEDLPCGTCTMDLIRSEIGAPF